MKRAAVMGATLVALLAVGWVGWRFLSIVIPAFRSIDEGRPEPLSALARSTQALDVASAVALAEEHLTQKRRVAIQWVDRKLTPDAQGRVFTLEGARSASEVDPKKILHPTTLCLARSHEGWLVWEWSGECAAEEWTPPVLPQSEREALLSAARAAVAERTLPKDVPKDCVGLERVTSAQVGYVNWTLRMAPPDWQGEVVAISSPVWATCPANWGPWQIAAGNCGIDVPWTYVVAFHELGDGMREPAMRVGGPLLAALELIEVASKRVLCRRTFVVGSSEQSFYVAENRGEAVSRFRTRVSAALCTEVSSLGGGALPLPARWRCPTSETR